MYPNPMALSQSIKFSSQEKGWMSGIASFNAEKLIISGVSVSSVWNALPGRLSERNPRYIQSPKSRAGCRLPARARRTNCPMAASARNKPKKVGMVSRKTMLAVNESGVR
jgi:hypothetical protein